MEANTKSTKTEAETIAATFCPAAYASLFSKGLKRVVEASKTSLDLAVEQNTEILASYKKVLNASSIPGLFLFVIVLVLVLVLVFKIWRLKLLWMVALGAWCFFEKSVSIRG